MHAGNQIGPGRLDHQVEMVAHQTIRMDLPLGLAACLPQCGQEPLAVFIVEENVLALVSAVEDVVHCSGVLDAQLARHGYGLTSPPPSVNSED